MSAIDLPRKVLSMGSGDERQQRATTRGLISATASGRRTRALAMVRTLYSESERVRAGRRRIQWCSIDVIVKQPADVDVLAYAVDQGWIAFAPGGQSVRVNDKGRRLSKLPSKT